MTPIATYDNSNDPELVITIVGDSPDFGNWLTNNVPSEELASYQEVYELFKKSEAAAVSAGILSITTDPDTRAITKKITNRYDFINLPESREYYLHDYNLPFRLKKAEFELGYIPEHLFVPDYVPFPA
jgi:hypothetical protein